MPLGEGIIADPFMGAGSTVAAAEAVGVCCIGVDRYLEYYEMSRTAVPKLADLKMPAEKTDVKNQTESLTGKQLTLW